MGFLLDTTFWIDLEREGRREQLGAASIWLVGPGRDRLFLSTITLGEFTAGTNDPNGLDIQTHFESATILPVSEAIALRFGQVFRDLKATGQMIGANDLWIACTALEYGLALVTRNVREFSRIDGLEVVTYGA